jgi:hypothetical protein
VEALHRRPSLLEAARQLARGAAHGGRAREPEPNGADVALVDEARQHALQRHLPAELGGGPARRARRGDEPALHHRDAPALQEPLDLLRRQPPSPAPQPRGDDRHRRRRVGVGRLERGVGRRRPAAGVADGVRERPHRLLRGVETRDGAGVSGRRRLGAEPDGEHRPVGPVRRRGESAGDPGRTRGT